MIWLFNRYILSVALIAVLALGAYFVRIHYEQVGYDRAAGEYTAKQLEAEQLARKTEQFYEENLKKAQDENVKLRTKNRRDAATATAAVGSLRDTISALTDSLPTLTVAAARERASTLAVVLDQCSGAYQSLAATADRIEADRQMILQAWPKLQTSASAPD